MAVIPRVALDYLTGQINTLSGDAQAKILTVLEQIEWAPENIADCRNLILEALQEILPAYTDLVAQAGADFYDAARELALGETLGAVAESGYEPEKTDNAVRAFVQDIVDGKPVEQFNDQVLQRVDYEMKHAAGNTMFANGARDPKRPKYARVPTGAETCGFCIMLASRGFDYTSKEAAGSLGHYHASCDCRIVASWDNLEVENYDPDAYYSLWKKSNQLENAGMPVKQRAAILAAMRDNLMPLFTNSQVELASLYDTGISSAWAEFKKLGKTTEAYEATISTYLTELGRVVDGEFSAEFKAKPNGEEIWAAIQLSSEYSNISFRYADYRMSSPDFLLDGTLAELKTPQSRKKVTNRLKAISSQFDPYPDERKLGIISSLYLSGGEDYIIETAQRFVDDGTLDEVIIIGSGGILKRLGER